MNARVLRWALLLAWPWIVAAAAAPRPGAVIRPVGPARLQVQPAVAPTDTPWVAPEPPHPTARYGSYRAASDSLRAIVQRALGTWADSARWSRRREPFVYHDAVSLVRTTRDSYYWDGDGQRDPVDVSCLHMRYASHTTDAPGTMSLEEALQHAGWDLDHRYSADGPDGTYLALACREALVEITGSWDGGDDSDSTYVPAPGEEVELRCVPRPPEPRPRGPRVP